MNNENKIKLNYNKYSLLLIILLTGYVGVVASLIGGEGGSSYKIFWVIVYIFIFITFFLTQNKQYIRKAEILVLIFGTYIILSSIWSKISSISILYASSYFMNILSALVLARVIRLENFLKLLLYILFVISFIGIVITFLGFDKGYYFDPLDRSNIIGMKLIKGLYSHKIYAGLYGSIGFLLAHLMLNGFSKRFVTFWFVFTVFVSGSSLGIVMLILSFVIYRLVEFFKVNTRKPWFLIFLLFLVILFLIGNSIYVELLTALGRDPGLTGRTELWGWAIKFFMQSPIIGWGYGGIFADIAAAPSNIINTGYYTPPHFHNGYLQALAELGVIGALVLYYMMLYVSIKSLKLYYTNKNVSYMLVFIILFLLMIAAMGMNLFMRYNELSIFLLVYFYLNLSKHFSKNIS